MCASALMLLAAQGCQSSNQATAQNGDILMGERPPDKAYGVAGPTPPPQNRAGMAPATPSTIASKSNAAMLNNPDPLLGGKNALAIADTPPSPPSTQPIGVWTPAATPVVLKEPLPTSPPPPPGGAIGNSLQIDPQLQAQLKNHGVLWQDQRTIPNGVVFSCAVPIAGAPGYSRNYEATAADLHSAVSAVLDQMEQKH